MRRKKTDLHPLPDHQAREAILEDLGANMVVEAAAGTGKTTAMVGRLVALLQTASREEIGRPAAVTFTRKAAAEIRARFQARLEECARDSGIPPGERANLAAALAEIDQVFVGTIHSFCTRLLRERPVEAGVDPLFRELTEDEDRDLRRRAWDLHLSRLQAEGSPLLAELRAVGLSPAQLGDAFETVSSNLDVEDWPAEEVHRPDPAEVRRAIEGWLPVLMDLSPSLFPLPSSHDKFGVQREGILNRVKRGMLEDPVGVMEILEQFEKIPSIVQRDWQGEEGMPTAKRIKDWWIKGPGCLAPLFLTPWREHRYAKAMKVILPARAVYQRLREEEGALSFQDLLIEARDLVRDHPDIRRYFAARYPRLLVDEFQDTDPLQAELLLLLAADDPGEKDWKKCRPRPGALFLVGDPKQSIYRFRRADIVTYDLVKGIIRRQGGKAVTLSANFRSLPDIITWVNRVFSSRFPPHATPQSPVYVPLDAGRPEEDEGDVRGLRILPIPEEYGKMEEVVPFEAHLLARTIRAALDAPLRIPRTREEKEAGLVPQAGPGDFLLLTGKKKHLAVFARALQELGIPCRMSGGNSYRETREVVLLSLCLDAVLAPENPAALVAVLRSGLFGVSDGALYRFRREGGNWSFSHRVPDSLPAEDKAVFSDAFTRLAAYALWLRRLPPPAAIGKIASNLGLFASAAVAPGGNAAAGNLGKLLEDLRSAQPGLWSAADLAGYLRGLLEGDEEHDSLPARPYLRGAVRLMNLHKAKGLEESVVFLADATGADHRVPTRHISREGERPAGFLLVQERNDFGNGPLLAQPRGWDEALGEGPSLKEREEGFRDAEKTRLYYVAATRARAQLVVTRRAKRNNDSYWKAFADDLQGVAPLSDPGEIRAPSKEEVLLSPGEVEEALGELAARWDVVKTQSYSKRSPGDLVPDRPDSYPAGGNEADGGTGWGTVIHTLLDAVMKKGGADLRLLAEAALREQELSPDRAEEAVRLVGTVTSSSLWRRTRDAGERKCFTELPFVRFLPGPALPTVESGVIDLVFLDEEKGGWVIVDYKTDEGDPEILARHYRPQVAAYAEAWTAMTGEPVAEKGFFFVTSRIYRIVP